MTKTSGTFASIILLFLCTVWVAEVVAEPVPLSGRSIRQLLSGRTVYLETPFGTELPIRYRKNGTMTGKGRAIAQYISDEAKPNDRGVWWVRGTSLCQKWRNWFDGKSQCFKLRLAGNTVFWSSANGESGKARLGGGRTRHWSASN